MINTVRFLARSAISLAFRNLCVEYHDAQALAVSQTRLDYAARPSDMEGDKP
jgi:hypothetical protein